MVRCGSTLTHAATGSKDAGQQAPGTRAGAGMTDQVPSAQEALGFVPIAAWSGPWASDDADANFKADIALHSGLDPMTTIRGLAEAVGLPVGAIVHYVLARYASSGSAALLELGPKMVDRLWGP